MNYYETLFIVHSALDSSRLKDIIVSVHDMMGSMNSKVYATDVWGKKKLSYLIEKQSYGTYVLVQFQSDGLSNNKIAVELEHNPNILAYLTTKIEEQKLEKDIKSLDEQLSTGVSGDSENVSSSESKQPINTADESKDVEEVESADESGDVEEVESADESGDAEEVESADESGDAEEVESDTNKESNNEKNEDENGTN